MEYLKLVISMREQAILLTYIKSEFVSISRFKMELLTNLNYRFDCEMKNSITFKKALEVFKK